MLVCNCGFEVFSVPCHVIMSAFSLIEAMADKCILEVLTDIQTWNDTFQIKVQSISAVDSEICSKTEARYAIAFSSTP